MDLTSYYVGKKNDKYVHQISQISDAVKLSLFANYRS